MRNNSSSERHIINNIKVILNFDNFFHPPKILSEASEKDIHNFFDSKIKPVGIDPEKKWITTWNHYLNHLKFFFRWLYNTKAKNDENNRNFPEWITPDFLRIKMKRTNRLSPYSQNDIWDREELLTIINYEPSKRNKAALALFWDLDARNHEVTLLKIKNIRLREKYGEGEVPHEANTGTGPILLTLSFPYVRDWLNEHLFKNELDARLICNRVTGGPIKSDAMWTMMKQLQSRISRMVKSNEIRNVEEREKLEYLLRTKKWNPYCIRHSAITADSDYLPAYALKKKVRWSMNSKQGSRYIKTRMGNELKIKILEHNGIIYDDMQKQKSCILTCPRCDLTNALDNKYCSKCSYPLTPEAFDLLKQNEEQRFIDLKNKLIQDLENKIQQILLKVNLENLKKEQ